MVRFSYDEPVVDGFHGVTYELDGAPLPSSTSSNFANLIDPRTAGALNVGCRGLAGDVRIGLRAWARKPK